MNELLMNPMASGVVGFCVGLLIATIYGIHKLSTLNNAPVLQYQYQGKLVTWKQQGYIGYVVALDFDDGCAGYMELYEDGDLSGKYVLVDLSCLELYHGSN